MIEYTVTLHDTLWHSTELFSNTSIVEALKEFEYILRQPEDECDESLELEMVIDGGKEYVSLCEHVWKEVDN